jgi:hypothetical protein
MAKKDKKVQPAIKGSWEDVIKASVKGNPTPKRKSEGSTTKLSEIFEKKEAALSVVAPDCRKYLLCQVGADELYYSINYNCPAEEAQKMEKVLLEIAEQFGLKVTKGRMPE